MDIETNLEFLDFENDKYVPAYKEKRVSHEMAYRMRTGEVYLPNKSDMKIGKKPLRSGITVIQLYNEIERILKS